MLASSSYNAMDLHIAVAFKDSACLVSHLLHYSPTDDGISMKVEALGPDRFEQSEQMRR